MGSKTRLAKATSNSESLRTTVPVSLVKQFSMRERDILDWSIDLDSDGLTIKVRHIKHDAAKDPVRKKRKRNLPVIARFD
jgi:hypothetical protein